MAVEPVEISGKRIENVEDVKREFARRPGSNILIEEKQITESRAINLQDVQFARSAISITVQGRRRAVPDSAVPRCAIIFIIRASIF